MKARIFFLTFSIVFVLLRGVYAESTYKEKLNEIANWVRNASSEQVYSEGYPPEYSGNVRIVKLWDEVNTTPPNEAGKPLNYRLTWDIRSVVFTYDTRTEPGTNGHFEFLIRHYKDCVSVDTEVYTQWSLTELALDAEVDLWSKDFQVVVGGIYRWPLYPEGFLNQDWWKSSKVEAQKVLEEEIDYWYNYVRSDKPKNLKKELPPNMKKSA